MKNLQEAVNQSRKDFAEPYWSPLSQFAGLVEEVGEVGRLLNHMYGDKPKKMEEAKQELGGELADVLYGLICIANRHNIDLDIEMKKVIQKATDRDGGRFAIK